MGIQLRTPFSKRGSPYTRVCTETPHRMSGQVQGGAHLDVDVQDVAEASSRTCDPVAVHVAEVRLALRSHDRGQQLQLSTRVEPGGQVTSQVVQQVFIFTTEVAAQSLRQAVHFEHEPIVSIIAVIFGTNDGDEVRRLRNPLERDRFEVVVGR